MDEINADPTLTPSQLIEALKIFITNKLSLLIKGKPGQGKTDIVKQVCHLLDVDLIIAHPVVDDPTDYKGFPIVKKSNNGKQEATFSPFGDLKKIITADKLTVHFADDIGQASKMVQAAYMQLLLNRAVNGHKVSDNVVFISASNRREDKAGVNSILTPLLTRYTTVVELINSLEDWVRWANQEKLPHEVISYIRYRPEVLGEFEPTVDMTNTPTPRGIHSIAKMLDAGVPRHLQLKLFAGAIGKERAIEFTGFLRIFQDLIDPARVILDPKNTDIPGEPSALYALCGALAARASTTNIGPIITYANRLTDEFSVLLVKDCISRDNSLSKCRQFVEWAVDHEDVLI